MKPFLYRFQVRPHHEERDNQGNVSHTYGDVIWEEPPGRESSWTMPMRVSVAMAHAEGFEKMGRSVALGIKSILDDSPWTPEYFASAVAR